MKLLIDMNLSPDRVDIFSREGWTALHWSDVGDPRAPDDEIMAWARANDCVVFTHDLDFGIMLAYSRDDGPSVIQVRVQDVMPWSLGGRVVQILRQFEDALEEGALVTVDENKARVRVLPIK
jgi:predicted nuclease of predicted toxin-antitoxin system